jgi:hypothetical protein
LALVDLVDLVTMSEESMDQTAVSVDWELILQSAVAAVVRITAISPG